MLEQELFEGNLGRYEILASGCDPNDDVALTVLYHRASDRCVSVVWQPGVRLNVATTALDAPLPSDVVEAAVAGGRLVVCTGEGGTLAVDLASGVLSRIGAGDGAATLSPCGRWLLEADDDGVRIVSLEASADGGLSRAGRPRAILRRTFDNPSSLAVVRGPVPGEYHMAVGCYGYVELVSIAMEDPATVASIVARARRCTGGSLPYDPVWLCVGNSGPFAYAVSDYGSALAAVDSGSGKLIDYPTAEPAYGAVRRVIPCADSTACLLETGDGETVHWVPGSNPATLRPLGGSALAWAGDRALVLDGQSTSIRETALHSR